MKYALLLLSLALIVGCGKKSDEQLYADGVEAQKGSDADAAIAAFEELTKEYPQSPKVPEALYAMGTLYQDRKKDFPKAIALYERIATEYPTHATAPNAMFLVGFLTNNELKNADAAKAAYEKFLATYPDNQLATSAKFELEHLGKNPEQILAETATPSKPAKTAAAKKK